MHFISVEMHSSTKVITYLKQLRLVTIIDLNNTRKGMFWILAGNKMFGSRELRFDTQSLTVFQLIESVSELLL